MAVVGRKRWWVWAVLTWISAARPAFAQEAVPPELVYAERYLEKGWYREAWELIDPLVRQTPEPTGRLLVAGAEATFGLDRIGDAMVFADQIHKKEEKAAIALTDDQKKRLGRIEADVKERFGVLAFEWPPAEEAGDEVPPTLKFVLEWSDDRELSEKEQAAFDVVFQALGREGVSDGAQVYLPKGRVSVNGIWKDIGDEPATFLVAREKPPARQRVASGDGLAFSIGYQGVPGYRGPSYADQVWESEDLSDTVVGVGERRYGLVGMPRFELSATHSLITQGWGELGIKAAFGFSPATGAVGTVPEGDSVDFLPAPSPWYTLGLMGRQSFHASKGLLFALSAGAQGLYTSRMRFVAQGVASEEDNTTCSDSTAADLMIVDRKSMGAGILTAGEASKSLDRMAARIGVEGSAGFNLVTPMPAQAVDAVNAPAEFGTTPCFEDEDLILRGWDLRAQLFFRMALW